VSYNKVGDVLVAQGNLPGALASFKDSLAIRDRLAKADPNNAGWQRDVWVSYWRLASFGTISERRTRWEMVIAKLEDMKARGILQPTDQRFIAIAKANLDKLQ